MNPDIVPNTYGSLFAAYTAIWVIVCIYLLTLQSRIRRLERSKNVDENQDSVG